MRKWLLDNDILKAYIDWQLLNLELIYQSMDNKRGVQWKQVKLLVSKAKKVFTVEARQSLTNSDSMSKKSNKIDVYWGVSFIASCNHLKILSSK